MPRRVLITARDLVEHVQGALRPYIGVAAEVADHRPIVEVVLDCYCYGRSLSMSRTVVRMITDYGVPSDVAKQIEEKVTTTLLTVIQSGFGLIHPCRFYTYRWFNDGDILVDEFHTPPPEFEEIELVVDPSDEEGIGDFVPERLRRG